MSGTTHAILLEPGQAPGFTALLERRSLALLPVGGKAIVELWLEWLSDSGYTDVLLLVQRFPETVRELVDQGQRWGLNVRMTVVREGSDNAEALTAARGFITAPTLVIGLDSVPEHGLSERVSQTSPLTTGQLHTNAGTLPALIAPEASDNPKIEAIEAVRRINDVKALYDLNMDLLEGRYEDPNPMGHEIREGVIVDRGSRIPESAHIEGPCRIGKETLLGKRLHLGPRCVIGSNVIIDDASHLRDCVILDGSFIGSHAELTHCIVDRRLVIRVDTGVALFIDDPLILDDVYRQDGVSTGLAGRIGAASLLLLLAIPYLIRRLGTPLRDESVHLPMGRDLAGEPRVSALAVKSMDTDHPHWRKLPWLFAVLRGRMPLFGISLHDDCRATLPEWARDLALEQPGVITLADVTGATGDGDVCENVLVTDSYYLATRGFKTHVGLTLRWLLGLFKSRASIVGPKP